MVLGSGDRSVQFPEAREYTAGGNLAQGILSLGALVLVMVSCHIPVTLRW